MLEGLIESLQYFAGVVKVGERPQVVEICGKTYCNKDLARYGEEEFASPLEASSLTALIDYIAALPEEFRTERMIVKVESPTRVRLLSTLNAERKRECLFISRANVSEFRFDRWYDQERFLIELQANFEPTPDLDILLQFSGNVVKKNDMTYSDDGVTQVATMNVGAASKEDVKVPNPVSLVPFRTFQEIGQPMSNFVFRMNGYDAPQFSLIEADNQMWKNEAVRDIKSYLADQIACMPEELQSRILIIG